MNLSVATEFSETPGPRSRDEGEFSGELFLDQHLRPRYQAAVAAREQLIIDLDGTEGYATSFLEAAFGGLAREFGPEEVLRVIQLKSEDEPYLAQEIQKYIREAKLQ
jgi:hypothetical protein